jgi:hypothetical protein
MIPSVEPRLEEIGANAAERHPLSTTATARTASGWHCRFARGFRPRPAIVMHVRVGVTRTNRKHQLLESRSTDSPEARSGSPSRGTAIVALHPNRWPAGRGNQPAQVGSLPRRDHAHVTTSARIEGRLSPSRQPSVWLSGVQGRFGWTTLRLSVSARLRAGVK